MEGLSSPPVRVGAPMLLFKLDDSVTLKATGRRFDVLGTENSGSHYYIYIATRCSCGRRDVGQSRRN